MWATAVDENGFALSEVNLALVADRPNYVRSLPPASHPGDGMGWRWTGQTWEAASLPVFADPEQPQEPLPPLYVERRQAHYPTVAAQLDMLWHAMDRGEIPKATDFYNSVAAVKSAFPKAAAQDFVFEVGKMPEA